MINVFDREADSPPPFGQISHGREPVELAIAEKGQIPLAQSNCPVMYMDVSCVGAQFLQAQLPVFTMEWQLKVDCEIWAVDLIEEAEGRW